MYFGGGEEILAKQPNTSDYNGGIIIEAKEDKNKIKFVNVMESNISENTFQRAERTSRPVARTRGRPKKSPSRVSPSRKSPSRKSPSRHSPSRKSPTRRSPARRSPGRSPSSRTRKLLRDIRIAQVSSPFAEDFKSGLQVEGSKIDVQSLKEADDATESIPLESRIREPLPVTRRSTRILSNQLKNEREQRLISLTRSVDRAVSLPVDRRAHHYDFSAEQRDRGLSMQRDRDLSKILDYEEEALPDSSTTTEKTKKEIELISKPQEWGGWIGALCLIFVLPIAIILPQIACCNSQCNSAQFRISTKWDSYLDLQATALYASFLGFLAIVTILPIGRVIDGQQTKSGRLQYRINGLAAAILTISILGVCEYEGWKINEFILNSCLQLSVSGWLLGTILATSLYIKGGRVSVISLNMYGSTNNTIYDFWQGREVNPRIGSLDVKLLLIRAGIIGTLIINSAVIAKSIQESNSLSIKDQNFTLLIAASLQIMYCLDSLVFEPTVTTSFKILYEGTGYMVCVGNLLYPFLLTLGTRYLLYQNIHQSSYIVAAVILCFFVGYIIYRVSNSQKHEFRKNPFSPSVSFLETISTTRGKKLLCSGLWGHVRHPNYLGDIIIHWSIACIALTKDLLPYYAALCCTLALIHRAIRDDTRCRRRYGSAWEQYCLRVKSIIIKRVF